MATAELVVAFSAKLEGLEASLKRVETRMGQIETRAQGANTKIEQSTSLMAKSFDEAAKSVKAFVLAYVGLQGLQALGNLAVQVDDLNSSIRRLQVITGTTRASAVGLFTDIQNIAARTGQPVQDLVNQFQRFSVATASLGATRAQLLGLVNTLAGFSQLSGQAPQEAAAAITQLSQGLASGRLNGDELRSVLENMPQLAQALARELGVTVGQLRQMGEEGKLTADRVFPALLRAGGALQAQLQGLPLTLRQGWQVAQDAALAMVAAIDRRIGATEFLARLLNNLGQVTALTAQGIEGANPNSGPAARIVYLDEQARAANRTIQELETSIRSIGRIEVTPFGVRGGAPGQNRAQQEQQLAEARQQLEAINRERADIQERGAMEEYSADARRIQQGQEQRAAEWAARRRLILEEARPEAKALREHQERLTAITASETTRRIVARRQGGEAEAQLDRQLAEERAASLTTYNRELEQAGAAGRAAAARSLAERQRQERQAEQLNNRRQRQVEEIARAGDRGMEGLNRTLRDWDATQHDVESNYDLFIQRIATGTESIVTLFTAVRREAETAAAQLYRSGEDPQEAIRRLQTELETLRDRLIAAGVPAEQVGAAVTRTMDQATRSVDQLRDKAEQTLLDIGKQAAKTFSGDLAQSIVDFVSTGEDKFDEMALNFAKAVQKMILEFLIFEAIVQGVSAASGGRINLGRRASGGPVSPGSAYIVGERGPELFSPTGAGHIYPDVSGGGGTVVNIYNQAQGTTTRQQERTNGLGGKEIDIYIEQVVQRGMTNGRFDNALGTSFGAQRQGRV
jgi:tape measure domain-containing protein